MYKNFYEFLNKTLPEFDLKSVKPKVAEAFDPNKNGNIPKWSEVLASLPETKPSKIDFDQSNILIGEVADIDTDARAELEKLLREFGPWRKGPFSLFGIDIDSEWRSDLKWDRLKDYIESLQGRRVLDIGCGNGYHLWRMKAEGAKLALGADPTLFYIMQFQAIQKYICEPSVNVLPLRDEDLPEDVDCFDTVFSMGVLYHHRNPLEHLKRLKSFLREGGELVLETLIIEGGAGDVLVPRERYAQMKNVFGIPSTLACEVWLQKSGFRDINLIDVTKTTGKEQRVTDWAGSKSLADFLDPKDLNKTIEGYPAPKRAIFLAKG